MAAPQVPGTTYSLHPKRGNKSWFVVTSECVTHGASQHPWLADQRVADRAPGLHCCIRKCGVLVEPLPPHQQLAYIGPYATHLGRAGGATRFLFEVPGSFQKVSVSPDYLKFLVT
jgi:hypothetical protein